MIYRAATSENFYYIEAKRVANVLKHNPNFTREELFNYIEENDLLEANNSQNLNKKFRTVYKRLNSLNSFLIEKLAEESPDIAKFINFVSIVLNEKIVYDFIEEVIKDKVLLLDKKIENMEFNKFLIEKGEQEEEVSKWTESSRKKIIVKLKKYLIEAGYLVKKDSRTKEFSISRPLIPMDIIDNIKKEYGENITKSLLLER